MRTCHTSPCLCVEAPAPGGLLPCGLPPGSPRLTPLAACSPSSSPATPASSERRAAGINSAEGEGAAGSEARGAAPGPGSPQRGDGAHLGPLAVLPLPGLGGLLEGGRHGGEGTGTVPGGRWWWWRWRPREEPEPERAGQGLGRRLHASRNGGRWRRLHGDSGARPGPAASSAAGPARSRGSFIAPPELLALGP